MMVRSTTLEITCGKKMLFFKKAPKMVKISRFSKAGGGCSGRLFDAPCLALRAVASAPWRGLWQAVWHRFLRATPPRDALPLSLARICPAPGIRCTLSSSLTRDFPGSAVAARALWAAQLRMLVPCAGWALRPTCSHPPLTSPRGGWE